MTISLKMIRAGVAVAVALSIPMSASAQDEMGKKVLPSSVKLYDKYGRSVSFVPIRIYTEYTHGAQKSDSSQANKVDMKTDRLTVGADFMTSSLWYFGVSAALLRTDDNGAAPFVPSIDTRKDISELSGYMARPITPYLIVGANLSIGHGRGKTIYNHADVNHEKDNFYSGAPFVRYEMDLSKDTRAFVGGQLLFAHGNFSYDANLPPRSKTSGTSLLLPVSVEHDFTPRLTMGASAQFNRILSVRTFANVPQPDRSTATIGANARYLLYRGTRVYMRLSRTLSDHSYHSTSATVGLSVSF